MGNIYYKYSARILTTLFSEGVFLGILAKHPLCFHALHRAMVLFGVFVLYYVFFCNDQFSIWVSFLGWTSSSASSLYYEANE